MVGPSPLVPAATAVGISLDQQLCLALYTASRAMTARYRVALNQVGLTYPQYLVMLLLWEDGPASVGGIGSPRRLAPRQRPPATRSRCCGGGPPPPRWAASARGSASTPARSPRCSSGCRRWAW